MRYLEASKKEKKLGLELFFTDSKGILGRIKKEPEDFIVNERSIIIDAISSSDFQKIKQDTPIYTYANVKSLNWETNRLVNRLSRELGINQDKIIFAGSKDKRAITTQLMAFQTSKEKLESVQLENVEISNIFQSTRSFKIGDLYGNDFEIYIRDLDLPIDELEELITDTSHQIKHAHGFPNFFGVQRFGIIRPITHHVGKLIVQKKYEEAVLLYIGHPLDGEPINDFNARSEFDHCWDFEWAIRSYPKHLVFERIAIKHLLHHPEDYIGALEQFPKNLKMMFVHSYQSYLFNKIICARLRAGLPMLEPVIGDYVLPIDDLGLPIHKEWMKVTEKNYAKLSKQCKKNKAYVSGVLFGCESKFADGEFGEIERKIIASENIEQHDFIIPENPKLSSKGTRREIFTPVKDFEFELFDDFVKMKFGLLKGSYATTLLREFLKADIRNY